MAKKSARQQKRENEENLKRYGTRAARLVLVSRSWNGKRKLVVKGVYASKGEAAAEMARLDTWSNDADYRVLGVRQFAKLEAEIKGEQQARRKKGAEKAAATKKKNGGPRFVLCPTCNAKSKKLFSEMGGLQTRRCQNGHDFEVDMASGFEERKRRVERTDRPLYVGPNMSYNDYVYGKFKDNPTGK